MIVGGYKLNGYNATYEKTSFDVRKGLNADKNCVLEVTDINSGMTYIFELDNQDRKRKDRKRKFSRKNYQK